ncbi:MAG: DUF4336 domain-containing protein [Wenzhouxiangellaceae bacterium]
MALRVLVADEIWSSEYPVKFGPLALKSRTTVVRLTDGLLWVHSPMPISTEFLQDLAEIGDVGYVVAPNLTHHLFYQAFLEEFPNARGFFAPGLDKKVNNLKGEDLSKLQSLPWSQELESVFVAGLPVLNETVWFHIPSGTLILADLLFSFSRTNSVANRAVARLLGVFDQLGMSRTMRWSVKSKDDFKTSIDQIKSWDIRKIILVHDQIVERDAKEQLDQAFYWIEK